MIAAWTLLAALAGCSSTSTNQREPALGVSSSDSSISAAMNSTGSAPMRELTPDMIFRQPWTFGDSPGLLIQTPHYRIYTTISDERVLDRLPVFCEAALAHYTSALVDLPMPTVPLETYLFRTRSQWQLKTQQILPDQADLFTNLGRGGFTTKGMAVLYYIDWYGRTRDTFAIAAHEGWHQYTQETFKHQLPIWLEEGIATYMEGYRASDGKVTFNPKANRERFEALRGTIRGAYAIPLSELLSKTPQGFLDTSKNSLLRYYAQVWGLTLFLAEGEDGRYRAALGELLTDAAEGRFASRMMSSQALAGARRRGSMAQVRLGPAVLHEYFNRDAEAFERQYIAYMNRLIDPDAGP
jgi:hypothetical protein